MNININRRQLLATMASTALVAGSRASLAQGSGIFRIGAPNCITGAGAAYGTGMQKMLQAGVEAVNAAGGAAGLKFEVSTEDTQTQPQAAVLALWCRQSWFVSSPCRAGRDIQNIIGRF